MHDYGFWSILPPILAIILAIRTKQVFLSLLLGIWLGWVIINNGNLFIGSLATIQALVDVFKDEGSTKTIMFSALVGALIAFIQRSGGVDGFIIKVSAYLEQMEEQNQGRNVVMVQFFAALTGLLIFVESSISVLTVGSLYRPIFDKLKISREKLAYLADSSSAPSCILIPFNAWGAYIMSLLALEGFENPFAVLFQSLPYNFYPILAIITVFLIVFSRKDFGPMKKAELRIRNEGKFLSDNAQPVISAEISLMEMKEGIRPRSMNMILPILTMVLMMPVMLIYTGWNSVLPAEYQNLGQHLFLSISRGSGSSAVLYAVISSLLVAMIMYKSQGIMKVGEMIELGLKGISGLIPLALLMLLAFAISNVCKNLGTGIYVAETSRTWISPGLVPFIVFIVSCFIAFSTGTSWGTFAIMISISVPMAEALDTNVYLTIAAALGGGIFGDHCSPISDTTIISSMASATDHIDHVKTQLPYALIPGFITAILYLIIGFSFS
ncbi:Na+/H+ antiporter NhaC family protein [soil metagenome]